tara:strand:- start:202 stop:717 length:516 start_codon:yes stop_codon:yes gene_type:complete
MTEVPTIILLGFIFAIVILLFWKARVQSKLISANADVARYQRLGQISNNKQALRNKKVTNVDEIQALRAYIKKLERSVAFPNGAQSEAMIILVKEHEKLHEENKRLKLKSSDSQEVEVQRQLAVAQKVIAKLHKQLNDLTSRPKKSFVPCPVKGDNSKIENWLHDSDHEGF